MKKTLLQSLTSIAVAILFTFSLISSGFAQQQQQCCLTFTPNNSTMAAHITVYPNWVPGSPDPLHGTTTPAAWFGVQVDNGQPIPAGLYGGFCVDQSHFLPAIQSHIPGTPYTGMLISTCDPAELAEIPYHDGTIPVGPPPIVTWNTWHLVNYILNHKGNYYWWDVQTAINRLVGGPSVNDPGYVLQPPAGYPPVDITEVSQILSDALHNGPSWTATCGDMVGVIYAIPDLVNGNTVTPYQLIILEVPCVCLTCPTSCGNVSTPYSSALTAGAKTQPFAFSIVSGSLPPGLNLDPSTGAITGVPTTAGNFPFTAQVVDSSTPVQSKKVDCSITIYPALSLSCPATSAQIGVAYSSSWTVSGGSGSFTYSVVGNLPPGLKANLTTGTISGTPTAAGTFNYTIYASDNAGCGSAQQPCSITVTGNPTANCVTINAVQGVAITPVTMIGSGGCGVPYTFSATGLPNNLTMSQSGTISGTPTVSGVFNYTVTITDSCGNKGSINCSVTVNPPPTANCVTINAPVQGVAITPVTMVASGGCGGPYTFVATGLPNGLTMSSSGTISGTPLASGTFNYTVTVTDNCGNQGTVNCSVMVNCTGQIGDFVWNDINGNGCQDANEPGIAGVTVALYTGCGVTGNPIMTTTTDNTGHYLFQGLCAGTYTVSFTTPAGYSRTTAKTGCKDLSQPPYSQDRDSKCDCPTGTPCGVCVTLTPSNSINLNVDCGYVCNGQIGDFVWNDLNGNGCQDANEPGIAGVTVALYAGCGVSGTPIMMTTTDNTGHYLFQGLCAGTYTVSFTTPTGYARTTANAGCKNPNLPPYSWDLDSKCDCPSGTPCGVCVTLTPAASVNLNVDCGYVCMANGQIGDFVWKDLNGNGCQDANEPGLAGVRVDLYAGCGVTGTPIQSVLTDNTGHYLFQSLCAGTYTVSFITPDGYVRTVAKTGCKDVTQPSYTQDRDSKCDCPTGTPCGVCVTLTPAAPINLNIDCGYVCQVNGQIGDYVWNDLNGNGCQDANEPGLGGVRVDLYSGCGVVGTPIQSVVTDNTGHYLFQGLCAGTYTVSFITPDGYLRTVANTGCKDLSQPTYTQDRDSKCDCPTGMPCGICVTLTPAAPINLNIDCGYLCLPIGQIGDFIWNDLNGNGCQDPNEPGIANVQVDLYSGPCGGTRTWIATTFTDSTGRYLFRDLCLGDYQVAITTPTGYKATIAHVGCALSGLPPYANQTDSKCDCSGASPCFNCVTLTSANPINLNIDCGYLCDGQIGNFVWYDLNGNGCQDSNEPGLANVQVDLYSGPCGGARTHLATTYTDATGHYLFTGLCAGDYQVAITTPAGFTTTLAHQACTPNPSLPPYANELDSKCDCSGASPCFTCVTLTPANLVNLNVDCGYVVPPPRIELKKSVDKSFILPGGQVTYTYVVKNTGGVTVRNVTVVDDNATPTDLTDDVTVGTVASLDPGQSQTFTFTETLPQQFCATINNQNVLIGSLYTTVLPSGDIQVKYVQHNVNDNRYGTGATAATGWSNGHTFNDLVGSDHAEFKFTDANGNVVLDFYQDYISQATSATFPSGTVTYPSGYGTLGATGGDGKMISGNSAYILSATTSLTDNLNKSPFQTGYLVNSPPETAPLSGISVPAGWNYDNSYTVVVSKAAFGAAGYGSVSIPSAHNSPAKMGSNLPPTPCQPCLVNVAVATGTAGGATLTASATAQVCFGTPPPPGISLSKTADKTLISPSGDSVTYTYTVQNTGSQDINNITVTDDNGTPADPSDDFVVGTIPTLAPNASASLTATRNLTPPSDLNSFCETINGTSVPVGLIKTTTLPSGDIQITYVQQNVNDNRYGTGATAATGWSGGHKFNDLVGSDKAEFQIVDGNGNLVLDFFLDYISQATSATFPSGTVNYPSGYGTLGVTGGDGKMVSGNPNYVLFATTSFTDDLNNPTFQTGYLVNSPPETAPLSGVSIPAGWDYNDSFTVVISKSAFGGNGFGGVTIAQVHNSPCKAGTDLVVPTPCQACIVNVANAVGTAADNSTQQATASAQVCFGIPAPAQSCNLTTSPAKADKNTIQLPIKNNGTSAVYLSELVANWPAANGKLKKVSLNGDIWAGLDTAPDTLSSGDFDSFNTDTNRRKIDKGQTKTLVLQFEKNADPNIAHYSILAKFGSDGSCTVSYP